MPGYTGNMWEYWGLTQSHYNFQMISSESPEFNRDTTALETPNNYKGLYNCLMNILIPGKNKVQSDIFFLKKSAITIYNSLLNNFKLFTCH